MTDKKIVSNAENTTSPYLSGPARRYVQNAKADGHKVLMAMDVDISYKNSRQLSSFMDIVGIMRVGDRDLAQVFLAGYVACATSYAPNLEDCYDDDLRVALDMVYENLSKNKDAWEKMKNEKRAMSVHNAELTRRDANHSRDRQLFKEELEIAKRKLREGKE